MGDESFAILTVHMRARSSRLAVLLCVVVCATVAVLSHWPAARDIQTEDRNHDGRPDVWRTYDVHGSLVQVAIDTNFDGRADVHEYYLSGTLVRRETDRNFDDRIDLLEEFDPRTHELSRSIVDADYDGTADLLVLFQHGQPVFSEWETAVARPFAGGDFRPDHSVLAQPPGPHDLISLGDPFRTEPAYRVVADLGYPDEAGLLTIAGLPEIRDDTRTDLLRAAPVRHGATPSTSSADFDLFSPRGPPLA
jgi:hypothetical protein